MKLIVETSLERPLLKKGDAGTEGIEFGFEGGRVVRADGKLHLFTSEMLGKPRFVKMRLAHWSSVDGLEWERVSTLFESSGEYLGQDPRASLWSPMPIYDPAAERWNLFYVAYNSMPSTDQAWYENFEGKIWRAVSEKGGQEGIGGPYANVGIVMEPSAESEPWEGLQGTDSFFPFQAGGRWLAFYGSAKTEKLPVSFWGVGLAESDRLDGGWTRCSGLNPVRIDETWVENPVVTRLDNGTYVALFDGGPDHGTFGYSVSEDGYRWSKGEYVFFRKGGWVRDVRTPLCLLSNEDDTYAIYYTAFDHGLYGSLGKVIVRIENNS
ncbi:hypothetical protein [Cohnella herbarum]|uniref:Uncharacterized protein n=1 Tax=Cohnella herbarum TaxID=2728023 RepID=A0A7Z2ZNT2_9BACL|nr:hypothetical protein [Cohnella herbarum]QJD86573.1 hypothetical protein HH215_27635 [Cohnella herbarum]